MCTLALYNTITLKFSLFFADVVDEDGMSAVESFAENNRMASGEPLVYQRKKIVFHGIEFSVRRYLHIILCSSNI